MFLEPLKRMFGETTISYVKIWNHPIETTFYEWLFEVPGYHHSDSYDYDYEPMPHS